MKDKDRACLRCGQAIKKCDGYVLARDLILLLEEGTKVPRVRELCGRCVLLVGPMEGEPPYTEGTK